MKKLIARLLGFGILCLPIFLVACQQPPSQENLRLGLVIDVSGVDDKSFNQSAWEAILRFAKENNMPKANYSYTHSMTEKEYVPNLSNYADQNMDLIISLGYYYIEPLKIVAPKYPDQKFLIVDGVLDLPNITSVTFASNEGAFLAGALSAIKATEEGYDTLGFLGGSDIPTVNEFEAGFEAGVAAINPDITILIEYAKDFANPLSGKELANKMYDAGARIIFNVAGGTGNGLIDAAKERAKKGEDAWVIGVDKDQYDDGIYQGNQSVVLTSILKNISAATYDVIQSVKHDEFKGGHILYTLKNNGVTLPEENPNLKERWVEEMKRYKQDIIDENIIVPTVPKRLSNKS